MKCVLVVLLLVALCIYGANASIPRRSSLRFQEVSENYIGDNMIGNSKLQKISVTNDNVKAKAITADKIADSSIYQRHFSPNSVTAGAASIDLVHLHLNPTHNIPAQTVPLNAQGYAIRQIPDGPESVQPWEGATSVNSLGTAVVIDHPDPANAYRVQGKARGPGVILGWYPAQNGHLLRYQSSRAIRSLTCADVTLIGMDIYCAVWDIYRGFPYYYYYYCYWSFRNAIWHHDLICATPATPGFNTGDLCTQPADQCGLFNEFSQLTDPQCARSPPSDTDGNPGGIPNDIDVPYQPDQCHSYTSVEDVHNPQEGVPVYSPSIERIEIDTEGVVELAFFGRGIVSLTDADPPIDIIVVVLLNEQYGA